MRHGAGAAKPLSRVVWGADVRGGCGRGRELAPAPPTSTTVRPSIYGGCRPGAAPPRLAPSAPPLRRQGGPSGCSGSPCSNPGAVSASGIRTHVLRNFDGSRPKGQRPSKEPMPGSPPMGDFVHPPPSLEDKLTSPLRAWLGRARPDRLGSQQMCAKGRPGSESSEARNSPRSPTRQESFRPGGTPGANVARSGVTCPPPTQAHHCESGAAVTKRADPAEETPQEKIMARARAPLRRASLRPASTAPQGSDFFLSAGGAGCGRRRPGGGRRRPPHNGKGGGGEAGGRQASSCTARRLAPAACLWGGGGGGARE